VKVDAPFRARVFFRENRQWTSTTTCCPSLDRIDSAKHYTRGNVRIVVQVANFAMNAWGLAPVHQLAQGILHVNGPYAEPLPSTFGPTDATIGQEPLSVEGEVVDTDQGMLVFPQRSDLIWPALAFIQTGEKNSQEIENYLANLFSLGPEFLEAKYNNGVPVCRNLVSWVLVELGHHKFEAIETRLCPAQAVGRWGCIT
jgi:hypothetical protein